MKRRKIPFAKTAFIILGFIIIILFSPIASFVFNAGSIVGMAIGILIVLFAIFADKIKTVFRALKKKKGGKAIIVLLSLILAAMLIYAAVVSALVMSKAKTASNESIPENATAILLGCSVNGEKPSLMLQQRIDAAYDYLSANEDAVCILSGGRGDGEDISEAQAMFISLTEKGIPSNRLILEDKSTSTTENICFSKEIIEENNLGTEAVIITTDFHQYRASLIAKDNGLDSYEVSAKSGVFAMPTFVVREWFSMAKYYLTA